MKVNIKEEAMKWPRSNRQRKDKTGERGRESEGERERVSRDVTYPCSIQKSPIIEAVQRRRADDNNWLRASHPCTGAGGASTGVGDRTTGIRR